MNVHYRECNARVWPLIEQAPEQSYGVGAPGDRNGDPLPGVEEMVP
jgi:hypothetical protein